MHKSWKLRLLPFVALFLGGFASLPANEHRLVSTRLRNTADTLLGRAFLEEVNANPGKTGVMTIAEPYDAFAARVALIRVAEQSLDVQYYIWHKDASGTLLLSELWQAAERGVRIRLLLDDNGISGLDSPLAVLDAHPNIEIRIFNPFPNRRFKSLGFFTDFQRLNHRMHNKSITADSQASIVGGRNVGDVYFGANPNTLFYDLDALVVGAAADDVNKVFDDYWNNHAAYALDMLIPRASNEDEKAFRDLLTDVSNSGGAKEFIQAVGNSTFIEKLKSKQLDLEWVPARVLADLPEKSEDKADDTTLLLAQLNRVMGKSQREIDLISPYFVPGEAGTQALVKLAQSGVKIRLLTNSLAANDVIAVHAGYSKRRKPLLRAGIRIFEMKPNATQAAKPASKHSHFAGSGTSLSSLHGKTFSIDRQRVFIGSFNFDPRSYRLNTEMGIVFESPRMANELFLLFDTFAAKNTYEVKLDAKGNLIWLEQTPDGQVTYVAEPKTSRGRRLTVWIVSLLPVEWML